jgi:deoxyribodipyrimidine photo-lyase
MGSDPAPALVWFRQDLRLCDNPALAAAVERGHPVIPVYIWAPEEEGAWPPGAASKWWLAQSLSELSQDLQRRGSRLIVRKGPTAEALGRLVAESGAAAVYWNRRYEPAAVTRDAAIESQLRDRALTAESFNGSLLFEPWTIQNQSGKPFQVFTAFYRVCLAKPAAAPFRDAPRHMPSPANWPASLEVADLALEPSVNWAAGFRDAWQPGEAGARAHLKRLLNVVVHNYPIDRDRPGVAGTSRLSPHLHFGEISPGQVWRAVLRLMANPGAGGESYLRQICWREFAYHLLYHHPESPEKALRTGFADFPWRKHAKLFRAWSRGHTGYPLVDAGMRELWRTGWMHNRVRMVTASFLVKHLLIGWQEGAAWFWDTLVDADLANNTLGWQWVAGCGADAAPYFRIFNPAIQAAKFDPDGTYIRRWIPEPAESYPTPIVDHDEARRRALAALASIKGLKTRS